MENILFLAMLLVCPTGTQCLSPDAFIKYISEPFEVNRQAMREDGGLHIGCHEELKKLRDSIDNIEGSYTTLCVQEKVWAKNNPLWEEMQSDAP